MTIHFGFEDMFGTFDQFAKEIEEPIDRQI